MDDAILSGSTEVAYELRRQESGPPYLTPANSARFKGGTLSFIAGAVTLTEIRQPMDPVTGAVDFGTVLGAIHAGRVALVWTCAGAGATYDVVSNTVYALTVAGDLTGLVAGVHPVICGGLTPIAANCDRNIDDVAASMRLAFDLRPCAVGRAGSSSRLSVGILVITNTALADAAAAHDEDDLEPADNCQRQPTPTGGLDDPHRGRPRCRAAGMSPSSPAAPMARATSCSASTRRMTSRPPNRSQVPLLCVSSWSRSDDRRQACHHRAQPVGKLTPSPLPPLHGSSDRVRRQQLGHDLGDNTQWSVSCIWPTCTWTRRSAA